jgi:hypothetical protein
LTRIRTSAQAGFAALSRDFNRQGRLQQLSASALCGYDEHHLSA